MAIFILQMEWTTGCEADASTSSILGLFTTKEKAEAYMAHCFSIGVPKKFYEAVLDIYSMEVDASLDNPFKEIDYK